MRIGHFVDGQKRYKHSFTIHEQKREKCYEVVINNNVREAFDEYLSEYHCVADNPDHFVFFNTKANDFIEPICMDS